MRRTLLINFLGIILVLILTELVFGGWLKRDTIKKTIPIVSFDVYYFSNGLYPNAPEKIHYKRDEYGLRGEYSDLSQVDILTLGGSTTDQRHITEGETWQDQLAQRLSREKGRKVTVVNGGMDGRSTYGHLKDLQLWLPLIPNLSVKYYLLYVGINDVFSSPQWLSDTTIKEQRNMNATIKSNSVFYSFYIMVLGNLQSHMYKMGHQRVDLSKVVWTETPVHSKDDTLARERLAKYESRLEALDDLIKTRGARVIYVTQTVRAYKKTETGQIVGAANEMEWIDNRKINGVDQFYLLDSINRKTMEVCRRRGGICLDLASDLEFNDQDFYDFWHNSPPGAKKIADYLGDKLGKTLEK